MSKSVSKNKKADLSKFIQDELIKNETNISVGERFIDSDGYIREIDKIYVEKKQKWKDDDGNTVEKPIKYDEVMVSVGYWMTDDETGERSFSHYGSYDLEDFKDKYVKINKSVEELKQEAIDSLMKEEVIDEESQTVSSETALVHAGSKEHLIAMKKDIEQKRDLMEVKMRMLNRILRQKKDELSVILKDFEKKVEIIRKVIYTIELYLGNNEEVMLLQDGERAPSTEPICFRQEILYMDEEVGDPEDDGIDFERIEDFDSWLLEKKNYKKIIPEQKGVIILRVRRKDKHYSDNPFVQTMMSENDKMTYILIRNGDRICRIWADIKIHPRLFPKRDEMMTYMKIINGEIARDEKYGYGYISSSDKESAEKRLFRYKQQMIMLQGMIDRTELFHPLPAPDVKIGSQESMEKNYVRFIYDDELKLPNNRLFFKEWQKKINATIKEGSRIIISGKFGESYVSIKDYGNRYVSRATTHRLPDSGIYTVQKFTREERVRETEWVDEELFKKKYLKHYSKDAWESVWEHNYADWEYDRENKRLMVDMRDASGEKIWVHKPIDYLIIKYNPKDTLYGSWGEYDPHERKNNISFIIKPNKDNFMLNFDEVSLDDVEFYLNNRLDRREYLWMMPCLHEIKKRRLAEKEFEKDFVKMMVGQLLKSAKNKKSMPELEKMIWTSIDWWKLKNKWKRGIDKDDAKALRMIKSRIEKQLSLQN